MGGTLAYGSIVLVFTPLSLLAGICRPSRLISAPQPYIALPSCPMLFAITLTNMPASRPTHMPIPFTPFIHPLLCLLLLPPVAALTLVLPWFSDLSQASFPALSVINFFFASPLSVVSSLLPCNSTYTYLAAQPYAAMPSFHTWLAIPLPTMPDSPPLLCLSLSNSTRFLYCLRFMPPLSQFT